MKISKNVSVSRRTVRDIEGFLAWGLVWAIVYAFTRTALDAVPDQEIRQAANLAYITWFAAILGIGCFLGAVIPMCWIYGRLAWEFVRYDLPQWRIARR